MKLVIVNEFNLVTLIDIIQNSNYNKIYIFDSYNSIKNLLNIYKNKQDLTKIPNLLQFSHLMEEFLKINNINLKYETNPNYIKELFIKYLFRFVESLETVKSKKQIVVVDSEFLEKSVNNRVLHLYDLYIDLSFKTNFDVLKYLFNNFKEYHNLHLTISIPNDIIINEDLLSFDFKNYLIIKHIQYGEDYKIFNCVLNSRS